MNYDGYYKYDDNIANSYDLDRQEEEHWKLENIYVEKLYRDINLSTLLDLPVGTGRFFQYYSKVEKIIGIDISDNMLNVAKKKVDNLPFNILLHRGDAFNLDYPDEYFEHIVCFRLMHLIPPQQRQALLNELKRVVSKKIILQIYMAKVPPLYKKILYKLKTLFIKTHKAEKPWSHIQAYSLLQKDFDSLLLSTNLKIVKKTLLCDYLGGDVYVFELSKDTH